MSNLTCKDFRIKAQMEVGQPLKIQLIFQHINNAMEMLAKDYETACVKENIPLKAKANYLYPLQENIELIGVKKVLREGISYEDFDVDENYNISFAHGGSYSVQVLKYPKNVELETEKPEINRAYNMAIVNYIAYKERAAIFGRNDPDAMQFYYTFKEEAEKAHSSLSRKKRTVKRIMKAPRW